MPSYYNALFPVRWEAMGGIPLPLALWEGSTARLNNPPLLRTRKRWLELNDWLRAC